jgi:long-chain fatty acid transport protein
MKLTAQSPCSAHKILFIFILSAISSTAFGAGFQISEQSGTGLGRAFAGFGVIGDDLSMAFYNPAGLTMKEGTQIQFTGFVIDGSSEFSNQGSTQTIIPPGANVPSTGGDENGGTLGVVPNLYFTMDLTERLKYGFAITAPYGLRTDYDGNWVGRYQAKESELITLNINPSLAFKINDDFSIGAGISAEYAEATLSQNVFTGGPDGFAEVKGDDWGYGWNAGIMYHPDPTFRAAIGFRSKIKHKLNGDLELTGLGPLSGKVDASAQATLPETIHAGIYKEFASKWGASLGFRWTKWDRFEELRIKSPGRPDTVTPQEWSNVISANIGIDYFYSDKWTFRAGYMYDESPTSDEFRTPRIPDGDRNWFAIGATYKLNEQLRMDAGFTHIIVDNASINRPVPIAGPPTSATIVIDNLVGEYEDSDVNILALQAVYKF